RKRTVSIGPQSEADAREYIAYREHKRRNSRDELRQRTTPTSKPSPATRSALSSSPIAEQSDEGTSTTTAQRPHSPPHLGDSPPGKRRTPSSPNTTSLHVDPNDPNLLTPPPSEAGASNSSDSGREDEQQQQFREEDREMFSQLEKPRIRYDVEVVTKLVVYAGIAWWAVVGNPVWFEWAGLV
ncbi:hypothetical protein KC331_g16262, partial [Hortaea werneckii]